MKSGYEKMLAGEPYESPDWDIIARQAAAQEKLEEFNALPMGDHGRRMPMLKEMLGKIGDGTMVLGRITFEFGKHIELGRNGLINMDCMFLDGAKVTTGDDTIVAPRVMFITATHDPAFERRVWRHPETGAAQGGYTTNKPISIGSRVWIGAGAIILPGVTVGDNSVIGAGSVVTKSIPAGVVAVGNPCRVIRENV
ncbi:MAG: sugar O-acetyltransferase [Hyphomicrobiales bacterium]|nr:MAG: sugar O-acetyltransferase [Hyphomicrobiales bacterium]